MTQQCGKGPAGSWGEPTVLPHSASSLALPPLAGSAGHHARLKIPAGTESWIPKKTRLVEKVQLSRRNNEDAEDKAKAAIFTTINLTSQQAAKYFGKKHLWLQWDQFRRDEERPGGFHGAHVCISYRTILSGTGMVCLMGSCCVILPVWSTLDSSQFVT